MWWKRAREEVEGALNAGKERSFGVGEEKRRRRREPSIKGNGGNTPLD